MTGALTVQVRNFDPADQAEAAELINSGLGDRYGVQDDSMNPDLYDIQDYYRDDCFLVAVHDGRIVGTGGLIYEGACFVRIVRMHTSREVRRRGVGSAVLQTLERRAIGYGARVRSSSRQISGGMMLMRSIERTGTGSSGETNLVFGSTRF